MSAPRESEEPRSELERELGELYRSLTPPPPADDLSGVDPTTADVVRWMQEAWRGLEVPPARLPRSTRPRPRPVRRLWPAAAAVLLVAAGVRWLVPAGPASPVSPHPLQPTRVAQAPLAGSGGVEILAVQPDRMELRSGPVRLVLLEPRPAEDATGM